MSLSENSGSIISQEVAENLIAAFQKRYEGAIISSFIGSKAITTIMAQEDCIGLRFYNGFDTVKNKMCLIVVGVDKDQKDLLDAGLIYDEMIPCPTICPVNGLYPKK